MKGDDVGAGLGKVRHDAVYRFDHQVHIDGCRGTGTDGFAHQRSNGQIGHIMVVHHVEMDPIGTRGDDVGNLFTQAGEIGGQDTGGNAEAHGKSWRENAEVPEFTRPPLATPTQSAKA